MTALHEGLRKQLERTVIQARDVAEEGANAALDRLGVGRARAYEGLSSAESDLRVRLRAKGKQLGDVRKSSGEQETRRLAAELAYEYWHRMLFARFLAENDLLMHPDAGVSVSLADCEELAREEGLANGWLLAERWAARMLPEIFRPADPLLQVPFAPEHNLKLESLLEALPSETFRADDALGWVYQFWQTRRKEEVNQSGAKVGAEELSPATQLFTEQYMVQFLLDNTIGAWWSARHAGETSPVTFEYLRLLTTGMPAAGAFEGWPNRVTELKVIDPCCGSGHFLVSAFLKLVPLRIREEGLSAREACRAVLRDNIFGLELDARCTQIAAFNLALAAWKLAGYGVLPPVNVACTGTALNAREEEWASLAGESVALRGSMKRLHSLFAQAPLLGSLVDPARVGGELFSAGFGDTKELLDRALGAETGDSSREELAVVASGLTKAAELLAGSYTLAVTNVPYLGRGKQDLALQEYCQQFHPLAKADLATCFVERCLALVTPGGSAAVVTPQNWLFLASYADLRKDLLSRSSWNLLAKLGPNAFQGMNWWAAITMLLIVSRELPSESSLLHGVDVGSVKDQAEKSSALMTTSVLSVRQRSQLLNPGATIGFQDPSTVARLNTVARSTEGLSTGDRDRFLRAFWELPSIGEQWEFFQVTPDETGEYGGMSGVICWEKGEGELASSDQARIQGHSAWGKRGVLISKMNRLKCSLYFGTKYDKMAAVIAPSDSAMLPALWAFCSSERYHESVREISQKVDVSTSILAQVPFDAEHWAGVARERYPSGLPTPHSSDPTQWVFAGNPRGATASLQVAVARLLGYVWPRQAGSAFPECPAVGSDDLGELADRDGIVCLPPVSGERAAADRLRDVLATSYAAEWSVAKQAELLELAGSPGATLESWLRDDFFAQHCSLFHQRPFIWHVWDGRKDGFAALVNYHRIDRHTLQTLAYTYLGDWIARQEVDAKSGVAGADLRTAAARALQRKLELILEGEPPYDIFVRWKPIDQQPVGWEPNLNDGVRLNIRPFVLADVLRRKPSIKWGKDRGTNASDAIWGEERFNSYEEYFPGKKLTNAMKLAARADVARTSGVGA